MKKKLVGAAFVAAAATLSGLVLLPSAHADNAPVTVRSSDFVPSLSDTRANGLVTVGDNGAGVTTKAGGAASTDKAAEYWATDLPLSDVHQGTLDWFGSLVQPGVQLVVNVDGAGNNAMAGPDGYKGADGILVGEDTAGYGTGTTEDWWLNNAADDLMKGGAPSHTGGFGSTNHGTLDQWAAAFPNARIVAVGFSLGSGAGNASGILKDVKVGATTYDFAGKDAVVAPPAVPSTAPTGLKVASTTTSSVSLSWDALDGAGTYTVYRDGVAVGTTHGTTFTVGGLHFNKAANFQVAAGQDWTDQVGPKSAVVSGKTQTITLAQPKHLTVVSHTATTVTLKVDAVANAEGYRWYASTQNAHFSARGYSDAPTYTVQGLTKGVKYYFTVAADTTTTAPGPSAVSVSATPK